MRETKVKNEIGITLVALVVTIIVLLILAGVTISIAIDNGGLISKAKEAKNIYESAAENEVNILKSIDIDKLAAEETVEFTIKYVNNNQTFTFLAYENETWGEWFTRKQGSSDLNRLAQAETDEFRRTLILNLFDAIPYISGSYNNLYCGDATDGAAYIYYNNGGFQNARTTDIISSSITYQLSAN